MEKYQVIIFFLAPILIGLILNKLLVKEKLLLNYTGYLHQKFTNNKSVPLMGGIIFIFFFSFYKF
jgi:UDP-N-acetylmuramyl pentapeptide phosphotransferase/UDP-N-acetylglucosamine-1-phosphate transferase